MTGEQFKTMRKRLGLSQLEAGRIMYVARGTLSKWERGKGHPSTLSWAKLEKFARANDVSLEELASIKGDKLTNRGLFPLPPPVVPDKPAPQKEVYQMYIIAEGSNTSKLIEEVNRLIARGYEKSGSLIVSQVPPLFFPYFYQSMVKRTTISVSR